MTLSSHLSAFQDPLSQPFLCFLSSNPSMAEETVATAPAEVAVVATEKRVPAPPPEPLPEAEKEAKPATVEEMLAVPEPEQKNAAEEAVPQSGSFNEESNKVADLSEPEKKALDELKQLLQQALNNHEFTSPPPKSDPPPPEPKPAEPEPSPAGDPEAATSAENPPPAEPAAEVVAEETSTVAAAAAAVDDDGAKTVEAIEETVVPVAISAPAAEETVEPAKEAEPAAVAVAEAEAGVPAPPPEDVLIWGVPLLGDGERSDVVLLKFLRARDFKAKDAFLMIKNTVRWRRKFGIEGLLEEELGSDLEKVVFMHGWSKGGHPVCYNVYGEFQNKELYNKTFSDEEKRQRFLRWRIQFLEKGIRQLDFTPTGICTLVQVTDLKNSPGPAKRELRQATNQALHLLQDNYPEFVAKQIFINVPWWYLAFNRMISPFLTQRTKSKFIFAGPSKTTETLFKYIAPGHVPVQYGGLSKENDTDFTTADAITEVTVKPTSKHTVELAVSEACVLVWELRVVGWEVSYCAEFVPSAEDGYTVIVEKSRKITSTDEPIVKNSFKIGEPGKVVLTIDNTSSKKKKLLYRSKTKSSSDSI